MREFVLEIDFATYTKYKDFIVSILPTTPMMMPGDIMKLRYHSPTPIMIDNEAAHMLGQICGDILAMNGPAAKEIQDMLANPDTKFNDSFFEGLQMTLNKTPEESES